ncbi:acyltransferase family protein [Trinickia mobilis]|uniref:acyltransferase family protein n=1 Tax=Trinickia mobilis TaxID=2816356 RepID=UPI001A8F3CD2|nr:acyltransferase [Trinickia mobilis]
MSDSQALQAAVANPAFPAIPQPEVRAAAAPKDFVIDAMRGFAALLVAYFHSRQVFWVGMEQFHRTVGRSFDLSTIAGYLTLPIAWGSAGVPIFFVISGYCIHRNAAMRLAANPQYRLDARNFWARRFARIYPVLLAALLLTLALDTISLHLPPVSHKIREIGLVPFLVNLFSLQGVASHTYGSNGALWTLSVEVQFYAVYPLLFAARRRFGMNAVLAAVAVVNVASAFLLERHDVQFFTSYWLSWTIGAYIAHTRTKTTADSRKSLLWYAAAAVLTALGCVAFHFGQYGAFQLWALGFACYLYKALDGSGRPNLAARVLGRFGDFSYSLYVIHLPILVCLASLLFRSTLQLSIWPSFGFTLVATAVAYVFYRLVELPAMQWSASIKPRGVPPRHSA